MVPEIKAARMIKKSTMLLKKKKKGSKVKEKACPWQPQNSCGDGVGRDQRNVGVSAGEE